MSSYPSFGGFINTQAYDSNLYGTPIQSAIYPMQLTPPPSVCFYHPYISAKYVCMRCGHSICTTCLRPYGGLNLCTTCFTSITGVPAYYLVPSMVMPVYASRPVQLQSSYYQYGTRYYR